MDFVKKLSTGEAAFDENQEVNLPNIDTFRYSLSYIANLRRRTTVKYETAGPKVSFIQIIHL